MGAALRWRRADALRRPRRAQQRAPPPHLTRTRARALCPALRADALVGALQYYDAQADDARHTMTVARTAAHYGAVVRSSTRSSASGDEGRVVGAELLDVETGRTASVTASVTINCTGVWTDDVQELAGTRGPFRVRASKGVHLVVPRDRINSETGLILRTEQSVLFVIPWGNQWLVGTTDTDWELDKAHPAASRSDINYLLAQVNSVLTTPLTQEDIVGVYAGLRPLLSGESEETSQLSREHAVARPLPGLISVAGGKYTTYRVMARDAVDAAAQDLGRPVAPSVTDRTPILGAEGFNALDNSVEALAAEWSLSSWRMRRLLDRYGSLVGRGARADTHRPDPAGVAPGCRPVPAGGDPVCRHTRGSASSRGHPDAAHAHLDRGRRPWCHRSRRTSPSWSHRCSAGTEAAAELELKAFRDRVRAERTSQTESRDDAADSARGAASDIRGVLMRVEGNASDRSKARRRRESSGRRRRHLRAHPGAGDERAQVRESMPSRSCRSSSSAGVGCRGLRAPRSCEHADRPRPPASGVRAVPLRNRSLWTGALRVNVKWSAMLGASGFGVPGRSGPVM